MTEAYGEYSWYGFASYKYSADNTDNTVALQLKNDDGNLITSDYAIIVPTRVQLEGLIWAKKPMYAEPDMPGYNYGPNKTNPTARYGDEEGWASDENMDCTKNRVHVWDSPEEALADPDGAALEVYAEDAEGIDLTEYLGVHYAKEMLKHKEIAPGVYNPQVWTVGTWKYGEEAAFGLHYEFQFVDYYSSTNKTHDSRYATFSDTPLNAAKAQSISKEGRVIVKTVNQLGDTEDVTSTTAVDREPLVRVMLKNEKGDVLLDGYILLHINYTPLNKNITTYKEYDVKFNLCDPVVMETTWAEFSKHILQEGLGFGNDGFVQLGMEKLRFDDIYWADCKTEGTVDPSDVEYVTEKAYQVGTIEDSHGRGYQLKLYNFGTDIFGNNGLPPTRGGAIFEGADPNKVEPIEAYQVSNPGAFTGDGQYKELGSAVYYPNGEGTTNHIFKWTLSEEELEFLTHDLKTDDPVKVTRWFRFIAKDKYRGREVNNYTTYPYVWVKMTMNITRDARKVTYGTKIDNTWYNWLSGEWKDKWSAMIFDIEAPRDGLVIDRFNNSVVIKKFLEDQVKFTENGKAVNLKGATDEDPNFYKFYFAPKAEALEFYTLTRTSQESTTEVSNAVLPLTSAPFVEAGTYKQKTVKSVFEGFESLPAAVQKSLTSGGLVKKEKRIIIPLNTTKFNIATGKKETTKKYDLNVLGLNENADNYPDYDQLYCKYVWPHVYINMNEPHAGDWTPAKTSVTINYNPWEVKMVKARDQHTWNEPKLEETLRRCAISYNAGAFMNDKLYSFNPETKEYILIATLNQKTGQIELVKDEPKAFEEAKLVLNAMGYEPNHANVYKELRAWVGVIANNGCDVAMYAEPEKTDKGMQKMDFDLNTFLVSWQRPINTNADPIDIRLDANTNENWIHLIDHLKLFDWRGDYTNQGYMYYDPNTSRKDNHYWFWGYYDVRAIIIDARADRIYTNIHWGGEDFRDLTKTSPAFKIRAYSDAFTGGQHQGLAVYHFDLTNKPGGLNFNSSGAEADLEKFMGKPYNPVSYTYDGCKQRFGTIYYENSGENLTEFDVYIPYTIEYEWGWISRLANFHINSTHGNHQPGI